MNFKYKSGILLVFALMFLISCTEKEKKETTTDNSKDGYTLVWSDEFETDGKPDPAKWTYEIGFIRANEKQYYTDSLKNTRIENGNLIIEARKEWIKNETPPFFERPDYVDTTDSAAYTSASLTTRGIVDWKYAKIEIKAKLPKGRGTWPAFWMLGRNWGKTAWPECGEIDIMEHVGYDPEVVHGTIHTKAYNHVLKTQKGKTITVDNPFDKYHIYALEWTPEKIEFLVDGKVYNSIQNEHKTTAEWPFDQAFHLKLNLAIGGGWGGQKGIDDSIFPQQMVVDYVRVYQKNN
jgi:beta-glucanase (GH16 family)